MDKGIVIAYGLAQVLLYAFIQSLIRFMHRGAPGLPFYPSLSDNLQAHAARPVETYMLFAFVIIFLFFVLATWERRPYLLRLSFIILFPAFAILYLYCGQAFEFRVLGEVYPMAALLVWKGVS